MTIHPSFRYNGVALAQDQWKPWLHGKLASSPEWEFLHIRFMLDWLNDSDFIEVQTSGSTGIPKMWKVSKSAMLASAFLTAKHFNCLSGTTALLNLSSSFIAGKMMLARAMSQGWNLTAIEPTAQPLESVQHAYDFAAFTPMQLALLTPQQLQHLGRFGVVIVGGAAVSSSLCQSLSALGNTIYETYGMAETLSHVAVRRIQLEPVPFHAIGEITFSVDEQSRLQIHAAHLSSDMLQTQDVVSLIDDVSFYYLGRYDRVINSGGIKLFAEAIEFKLATVLQQPFAVTSHPDEVLGERVVVYIESKSIPDEDVLRERMRSVLERYEMPKEIVAVDALERTTSGKIKQIKK